MSVVLYMNNLFIVSRKQVLSLSLLMRFLLAFALIGGFYAWIVVGFGLKGRLETITFGFSERAALFNSSP